MIADRLESLLVAVDRSEPSRAAIDAALTLARRLAADVQLIEVDADLGSATRVFFPRGRVAELAGIVAACAEKPVPSLLGALEEHGAVGYEQASGRSAVEVIVEAAKDFPLLVIGTHGRHGADRLLHGSIAEDVVRRVACPVLVVPARVSEPRAHAAHR